MRRVVVALGLTLTLGSQAFSQAPSQLELVRALRSAGLVDLAVQRLEELKAKPNLLTPDEAKLIPLELARIRLEEATRESDDARRTSLIFQARGSFDEFIKANPMHPMAAQANVEIARLFALQAKGQLSKANRIESRERKALEFSRARPDFTTAYNRYQGAITNLDNRLKSIDEKDPLNAELKRSKAQAELDAGVLQYELGLTFIGEDEARQRSEVIDKAQKAFDKIADRYQNTRIGLLAAVWSLQCGFVNGEAAKVVPLMEKFVNTNRNNRDAADAVRLASFFGIEHVYESDLVKDTNPAGKFIRTEQAAQRWLQAYPDAKNTPEGLGARYRRGLMKELQAFLPGGVVFSEVPKVKAPPPMPKPKSTGKEKEKEKEPEKEAPAPVRKIIGISPAAKQLLEDANKIYKEISETDNEYSERSQRRRLMNQLVILEAEGKGGDPQLKSINTLEQGYLAAQVQQGKIFNLPTSGKSDEEQDKEEKKRIELAVNYLERGLQRATPKDAPRDVFDAQMLLVSFLSKKDRAIEAAVLGEGLARNNPKMPKASVAAALAVFAYNSALAKLKETNAEDSVQESDVKRIVNLAAFAEKTWPNDGATDAIRHVLSFYQANRDKDYEAAWQTHSRISSGYTEIYQARREMAAAMFYLIRPQEKDPKKYRDTLTANITKRAKEFRATLAALESLQEPPASAPTNQAEAWAGAKTMQAQLYYMNSDYDKVDAVVKATLDGLKKLKSVEGKKGDDLGYTIRSFKFNALQGRAADFIKAKEFAKVGESLAGELDAVKKEMKTPPGEETPGFSRMRNAQRGFIISAMSAFVQNKQVDQASEMLEALQSSGASLEQNVSTMRSLNTAIQSQIEGLTKEGKKADADELAKSFTEFLDKIKGDDTSKLTNGVILFLGQGYGAVNQNTRAAELFDQLIKKPFEPDPKDPDSAAKHANFVRQMEYLQARAYRQAGNQGGGKADYAKATALMTKIVGNPTGKGVPQGWGYRNIEIRKEYIMLLEDQNFFGPAVSNWVKLTNEFVPGGLPQPVKFLGLRQTFGTRAESLDLGAASSFQLPTNAMGFVDAAFKNVYPQVAERRNQLRQLYFDFFFEAQRSSAKAYTTPAIVANVKGGQPAADQKLADIGQKLFDLVTKNDDVSAEVKEKIQDFLNEERYKVVKKKFEELTATLPKATP